MILARKIKDNFLVELREQLDVIDSFTNEFGSADVLALREDVTENVKKETAILQGL